MKIKQQLKETSLDLIFSKSPKGYRRNGGKREKISRIQNQTGLLKNKEFSTQKNKIRNLNKCDHFPNLVTEDSW